MKKVILYYDYFITLPSEIDHFWYAGPHSWASILFLANRYVALLGHLPLFYVIITPACKAAVGLNCSIFRCFLILPSASTCEPLYPHFLPSPGLPAELYRASFSGSYHSFLLLVLTILTGGVFHIS